jgi:hypothetical protein
MNGEEYKILTHHADPFNRNLISFQQRQLGKIPPSQSCENVSSSDVYAVCPSLAVLFFAIFAQMT